METKAELRTHLKACRDALAPEHRAAASAAIAGSLTKAGPRGATATQVSPPPPTVQSWSFPSRTERTPMHAWRARSATVSGMPWRCT